MKTEPNYITINRSAYDLLAPDYRARAESDRVRDVAIVAPFVTYLKKQFGTNARILDIGPGNGVNLRMFSDLGFHTAGIDISPNMLAAAHQSCPKAALRLGDFLTEEYPPNSFEGIFAKALIHLFPKHDAVRVIDKIYSLLVPNGIFYVTTTACVEPGEGYLTKSDYPKEAVRYRKRWTPEELANAVTDAGFLIKEQGYNDESERNKQWYNVWAIKP